MRRVSRRRFISGSLAAVTSGIALERACLAASLVPGTSSVSASRPSQDLAAQLQAAKAKADELQGKAYAADPSLSDAERLLKKARQDLDQQTSARATAAEHTRQLENQDPNAFRDYEQLAWCWGMVARLNMLDDPVMEPLLRYYVTRSADRIRESANLIRGAPELKHPDQMPKNKFWQSYSKWMKEHPEMVQNWFKDTARATGLPAKVIEQAKVDGETSARIQILSVYAGEHLPVDLVRARVNVKELGLLQLRDKLNRSKH